MRLFSFKNAKYSGERLDDVLVKGLSELQKVPLSKGQVRKAITAGQAYLNESLCKICSKPVKKNAVVSLWLPAPENNWSLSQEDIVFEDQDIIVFNKPSGLATQPTLKPEQSHLYGAAIEFLTRKNLNKLAYVGLHHRLDQDTSGLVLMTKRKSANKGVADLFLHHRIKKHYLAVTDKLNEGLQDRFVVKNLLARRPQKNHHFFFASVKEEDKDGQTAETRFSVIEKSSTRTLLQAEPITGRTHQIRVHLSEMGLPIWGDRVYGKNLTDKKAPRLLLHCHKLEFQHPVTKKMVAIEAPLPKEFA